MRQRVDRPDLLGGRQHPRQRDGAGAGGDFHGYGADFALAARLDPQPSGEGNVEAAQQRRIVRQLSQHRGLQSIDARFDRDAAAVAGIGARKPDFDRLAGRAPLKRALAEMATPASSRWRRAWAFGAIHVTPLVTSRSETRALHHLDGVELAQQRMVIVLGQQLLDQQVDELALRARIRTSPARVSACRLRA